MLRQLRPRSALFKQSPSRLILGTWESSRSYSIQAKAASTVKLQDIDPAKLSVTNTTTPKELVPPNELVFGRTFTGKFHFQNMLRNANRHQIICSVSNGQPQMAGYPHELLPTKISPSTRQAASSTTHSNVSKA
jgi:hypothetical protein